MYCITHCCGRGWLRGQLKAGWLAAVVSSTDCHARLCCPKGMEEAAAGKSRGHTQSPASKTPVVPGKKTEVPKVPNFH